VRRDIPRLLKSEKLDGALVMDAFLDNPNFKYATRGAELKAHFLVPVKGRPAVLYGAMERDSLPAIEGLRCMSTQELTALLQRRAGGKEPKKPKRQLSMAAIQAGLVAAFLAEMRFKGRLALVGKAEAGDVLEFATVLKKKAKGVTVVFDGTASNLFKMARATKEPDEIDEIARAGRVTEGAIRAAVDHIARGRIVRGVVVDERGRRICIGHLRDIVVRTLAQGGMDCPETPIIAQGEEAAVPHNVGTDGRPLRASSPLVLDIFPRMTASGYFFDTTRTVCPGPAPAELQRLYAQVLAVQKTTLAMVRPATPVKDLQEKALDMFEAWDHPTLRTDPTTTVGYCHSLGHGLGLNVHEWPNLNLTWEGVFVPGHVVTVEPGLYYADRGIGIRIEDTVAIDATGRMRNLCRNGKKLEIPLAGA